MIEPSSCGLGHSVEIAEQDQLKRQLSGTEGSF